jgi:NAD(P)-dependent dehydrogenase (short-subunit alcohol dehydrogenase family)
VSERTVVVTAGTKGIGKAVAQRFEAAGDRVVAPGHADLDVTDEGAVASFFADVGDVDVLVANAGIGLSAPVPKMRLEDWNRQQEVNATGTFLGIRAALPGMIARDRGRIVAISSIAGVHGGKYIAGYSASKHAVVGLIKSVALEVAGTGVTANAVCPAYVRTAMSQRATDGIVARTGSSAEEAEAMLGEMSALGRLIEPDEVAFAAAFLAAPEAGAINGQTLVIDGGGVAL